jgi:hypothetical protein
LPWSWASGRRHFSLDIRPGVRYDTCAEEGYGHKRSEFQWQAIQFVGAEPDPGGG